MSCTAKELPPCASRERLCSLQVEGENDEQSSTEQASAVKTKNVFIAQNVASLQELGKYRSACCSKAGLSSYQSILRVLLPCGGLRALTVAH